MHGETMKYTFLILVHIWKVVHLFNNRYS